MLEKALIVKIPAPILDEEIDKLHPKNRIVARIVNQKIDGYQQDGRISIEEFYAVSEMRERLIGRIDADYDDDEMHVSLEADDFGGACQQTFYKLFREAEDEYEGADK